MGLTTAGVTGSIGVSAIGKASAGTSVSGTAAKGVSNVMGQMPLLGTITGTGMLMGAVKEYIPKYYSKSYKKYRR